MNYHPYLSTTYIDVESLMTNGKYKSYDFYLMMNTNFE